MSANPLDIEEKELELIRDTIDQSERLQTIMLKQTKDVSKIISILEKFIKSKKLICYGGTAINELLPKDLQFYNKQVDIPDYDIYSTTPLEHAKEIADIYAKKGFLNIEVKAAVHRGTYKVNVNFISVLDLTYIDQTTFNIMKSESIKVDGIIYAPINYLRMSMYKELSRPNGEIGRWEKVLKRLILLNTTYPMKNTICDSIDLSFIEKEAELSKEELSNLSLAYNCIKDQMIKKKLVFIGGYATSLYDKYMTKEHRALFKKRKFNLEVLSDIPLDVSNDLKTVLEKKGFTDVKIIEREKIGHLIDVHYEIVVGGKTIAIIYNSMGCYNYNTIKRAKKEIRVGTMDTILTFILGAMYTGRNYYNNEKLLCLAQYIFNIQMNNRLKHKGLLKRFTLECVGYEKTFQEVREEKLKKYRELKNNRESEEFKELFFRYNPNEKNDLKALKRENNAKTSKDVKDIKKVLKKKTRKQIRKELLNMFF
jgi:hypothetical protein